MVIREVSSQVFKIEKYRSVKKKEKEGKKGKKNLIEISPLFFSMHQIFVLCGRGKAIYTCVLSIINKEMLICLR